MTIDPTSELSVFCDLTRLKQGGGLQVGLSFLESLPENTTLKWEIIASQEMLKLARPIENSRINVRGSVKSEAILSRSPKAVHFQLFGPGRIAPRLSTTITGCAYSNLLYPEFGDFWAGSTKPDLFRRRMQDAFRRTMLQRQDELIFETEALRQRCIKYWAFSPDKVHVIRPSISEGFVRRFNDQRIEPLVQPCEETLTLAMISGSHPNKRLRLGVETLAHLLRSEGPSFRLLFTIQPTSETAQTLTSQAKSLGVEEHIHFIGNVPQANIASLYKSIDAVLLFSRLESFSNNVIECMASKTPLFVTDADWARSQAQAAAIYVEPTEPEIAAKTIANTLQSQESTRYLEVAAQNELKDFPSSAERIHLIENLLFASDRRNK